MPDRPSFPLREGDYIVRKGVTVAPRYFRVTGWTARGKIVLSEVPTGTTFTAWWATRADVRRRYSYVPADEVPATIRVPDQGEGTCPTP